MALPPNPIFESAWPQQRVGAAQRLGALAAALRAQLGGGGGLPDTFGGIPTGPHGIYAPPEEPNMGFHHFHGQVGAQAPDHHPGLTEPPHPIGGALGAPGVGIGGTTEAPGIGIGGGMPGPEPGPIGSRGLGYSPPLRKRAALAHAAGPLPGQAVPIPSTSY